MNAKEELTKLIKESYERGVKDAKQEGLAALEKVVAVMVVAEREACAKVVEAEQHMFETLGAAKSLANAIRARGQA